MATMQRTGNAALINKIRTDGVFGGGVQSDIGSAMNSTFDSLRAPLSPPVAPTANVFGGGMPAPAAPTATAQPTALNLATGNIFGGGISPAERNAAVGTTVPEQLAATLSGAQDQAKVTMYNHAVKQAGFNLDPVGQFPVEYQGAVAGARKIYDNIFGATGQASAPAPSGGYQAFAPSDLRARTIAANGSGVFGTGDVAASFDGMNAQGGRKFSLGQIYPGTGDGQVPNPVAPQTQANPIAAASGQPSAYQQNAQSFKDHLVAQQMQAGLMKSLPPGYMLDAKNPGRIMPIPGGPAEQKISDEATAKQEKLNQIVNTTETVVGTIDKILPKIDSLTAGPIGGITQHVPGTAGYDVAKLKDTVLSNIGITQLQQMRDASKNGSSGFGQLSEKELAALQASLGSLDQAQSPSQLKESLNQVRDHFNAWKVSHEAGQKANAGTLTPVDQAKAILAIRAATKKK